MFKSTEMSVNHKHAYLYSIKQIIASASPFVRKHDYAESFKAIFMKRCRIIVDYFEKNPLNFGIGPIRNGPMAAILGLRYNVLHMKHTMII